jgi:transposase
MVMNDGVLIGVDPHKASNTIVVLVPATRSVIAKQWFANTVAGRRELAAFAGRWPRRRWAVEGCHGAGRSLAQQLVADGETVLDVPAKLSARVRVYSQGHGRKTDDDDAYSIALAALHSSAVRVVDADDELVSLRLWSDRREELTASRTQAACRLHRLLAELIPGGAGRRLTATRAAQLLDTVVMTGAASGTRVALAREHVADIAVLDGKIAAARRQISAMVDQSGSGLTGLLGVGPIIAGRILAEVESIDRFASKDHFASYNGTAPIDASSGEQVRHRLSRAGNRRINHALHMMAVSQIRQPASAGRAYYERKRAEGKTSKEALRCLKRRLSDVIYRQLLADRAAGTIRACGSATTPTPTPPTSTSASTATTRPTTPPRPRSHPASRDSSRSTGKTTASSASRSSTPANASTRTSSTPQTPPTKRARSATSTGTDGSRNR